MKKVFFTLFIGAGLVACKNDDKKTTTQVINQDSLAKQKIIDGMNGNNPAPVADPSTYTTIQWLDSTYLDLGKQKEGKEIEISFRFKNTGTKNLVIETVTAQCGCTIPEKPEQPFAPGEEGVIKAKFNGSGHDETRKQVYVKANISPDGADTLTFRAQLVK
ncbi:MAG: DUF1573 domain-containing protein [Chitinophagaceae bacterium]|nr:DUF1573 domain-containing protein [Chitinophagaceae bacterium]